jgi:hypothetical protein
MADSGVTAHRAGGLWPYYYLLGNPKPYTSGEEEEEQKEKTIAKLQPGTSSPRAKQYGN